MKRRSFYLYVIMIMMLLTSFALPAYADKSSVSIDVPDAAKNGAEITITINVKHHGNNFMHHTQWVYVKVNGKEIARWDYTWRNKPESENFSKQVTFIVTGKTEIESEASCNIHGSAGKSIATLSVK